MTPMTRVPASAAREILRLRSERGGSIREVASCCGVGIATAHATLERARAAGITWPAACALDDEELTSRLYASTAPSPREAKGSPDLAEVARAQRSGKPLIESWREYRATQPEHQSYSYSHFCQMLKSWRRRTGGAARSATEARRRHFSGGCSHHRHAAGVAGSRF